MSRYLLKTWKNGRGARWTARIRWYEGEDGFIKDPDSPPGAYTSKFRLETDTPDERRNHYFDTHAEATKFWDEFREQWAEVAA